jgi:hypothetical protein
MGVNNSTFDPKNRDQTRNLIAQAQMALMGYAPLPNARTPGFKTDTDLVQVDQFERYKKDKTGERYYNSDTPEGLAKKIQEAFAQDELAQKNLRKLALKAGDPSQSLTTIETYELQAGLRAMGHDVTFNGNSNDPFMRRTAELIAGSDGHVLQGTGSSKLKEFQQEMQGLGFNGFQADGRFSGDMMMSVGDMMSALSRTDNAAYKKIIDQLGHQTVTKNDLEDPVRFGMIKEALDGMAGKKAENAAAIKAATWPASLGEDNVSGGLAARHWGAASQVAANGYDHKGGIGPTYDLSGLPQPDPGQSKVPDGLGGMKDGPVRWELKR